MRAPTLSAERSTAPIGSTPTLGPRGNGAVVGGRWRLIELLATGGSAEVWHAVDAHGASAALKLLPADWHRCGAAVPILRREHELLEALAHPNVVRSQGLVLHDGVPVALALEWLPGGDLVALLGSPPRHWLGALRGVLGALAHLHARGFAHRDLKARNVLFAADGVSRLIDFASARPLDSPADEPAGMTAAHAPPAPATGRDADQFAFAVLLYELLTGRLPFGVGGARGGNWPRQPWVAPDPAAARLLDLATAVLEANGHSPGGLSVFADVLESAVEAYP